jgi:hypothetical protein
MGDRRFVVQPGVDGLSLANLNIVDAIQHPFEFVQIYAFNDS